MHVFLDQHRATVYALLRIVGGFMFAFHGVQKIFGVLSEFHPAFGTQLWFAGIIELVGGAMIMTGWMTRIAAFIASGEMAVAYVQVHWQFALGPMFFPTINHGELAALYSFVFLYVACKGGGRWSLDRG